MREGASEVSRQNSECRTWPDRLKARFFWSWLIVSNVSLSHEVLRRAPEFERTSTTVVNAYVGPVITRYVRRLEERLRAAGLAGDLLIARSNGGVCLPAAIERGAVATIGSGPTGGAVAAGRRGGGRPRRRRERRHGRHVLVPDPRRPTRGQDRVELATPLSHPAPDGRCAVGRRRRAPVVVLVVSCDQGVRVARGCDASS